MRIKKILSRNRRDFYAIYECEHCGYQHRSDGYDDAYFHKEVVPLKKCPDCGKIAPETYKPKETKYPDGQQV